MNPRAGRALFYLNLYLASWGLRRGRFLEIPKEPPLKARSASPQRIHFWTPARTPGANVIVHDVLPILREEAAAAGFDWVITAGPSLAAEPVNWLVCFKAVPPNENLSPGTRTVLLICDQVELFWHRLTKFDHVIATASRPLANVLAIRHPRVAFIPESEPIDYLAHGRENLARPPAKREPVLMWHGGKYSFWPMQDLRPIFERLAADESLGLRELHVISGQEPPREESWGKLRVRYFPWSREQLFASSRAARLGVAPARAGVRMRWIKPASRVRCLHALGVPTIADAGVPDVADFLGEFNGASASSPHQWFSQIQRLWRDHAELDRLAREGHAAVAARHSNRHAAWQWIRYFSNNHEERGPMQ